MKKNIAPDAGTGLNVKQALSQPANAMVLDSAMKKEHL